MSKLLATPFMFFRGVDSNGMPVIIVKLTLAGVERQIILPKSEVERLKQCCDDSLTWLNSDDPISSFNGPTDFNEAEETAKSMKRAQEYQRGLSEIQEA